MSAFLNDESANAPSKQEESAPPPLAALFLIKFDVRIGYTLSWHQSIDGVELEGVVEYKSLPSGLHNLTEDLVYFIHEDYAGLSAFASGEGGQAERGARFVAVGILTPLNDGRLGRAWLHIPQLKELAKELVGDPSNTAPLEQYWNEHRIHDQPQSEPSDSKTRHRTSRSLSTATMVPANQSLPRDHPALSILEYLDTFGPLVFPLHRAAMLRQRILLVRPPPVQLSCDYVYNISVLSSLPLALASILTLSSSSLERLRPLFTLGIHDIPFLESLSNESPAPNGHPTSSETSTPPEIGWVGNTTDEILSLKSNLFDLVVQLPSTERLAKNQPKRWPVLKRASDGKEIKATQRDLRRYRSLRRALGPVGVSKDIENIEPEDDDERTHLLFGVTKPNSSDEELWNGDEDKVVEPSSWGALAYSSFIWWASAGERDDAQFEEDNMDQQLLGDIGEVAARRGKSGQYHDEPDPDPGEEETEEEDVVQHANSSSRDATLETAVLAYFHRITKRTFEACHEALDLSPDDDNSDQDDAKRAIGGADMRRMGLDVWSEGDKEFVEEFARLWFGKEVEVRGMGVECCGVRIC